MAPAQGAEVSLDTYLILLQQQHSKRAALGHSLLIYHSAYSLNLTNWHHFFVLATYLLKEGGILNVRSLTFSVQ